MSRLLALLSVLVVLGGCGGDPPPAAPPEPTASHSETPAAAPVMPEEAKEDSKEGAEAFVKYYVDELNRATRSGDTRRLRRLHLTKCGACNQVADLIEQTYSNGGHIEGDGWGIENTQFLRDSASPHDAFIRSATAVAPQRLFPSPDASPATYEGNPNRELLWGLRFSNGRWHITSLQVAPR